jgi:methyl-accepting chemotaxis protein
VVQRNAANAEESASASEEMNTQAGQMKGFVEELVSLVNGSAKGAKKVKVTHAEVKTPTTVTGRFLEIPATKAASKEVVFHQAREVRPEQVIPMDDDGFKDF